MNTFPPNPTTQKVVINVCYGGYSINHEAILEWCKRSDIEVWHEKDSKYGGMFTHYYSRDPEGLSDKEKNEAYFDGSRGIERNDPILAAMVEESPGKWDGEHAELRVVEIPTGVSYHIDEYDGMESIHEDHRSWS